MNYTAVNKEVARKLNIAFGYKPKKKKELVGDENAYFYCKKCKAKLDYKICVECGKLTHCGQPMIKKQSYYLN